MLSFLGENFLFIVAAAFAAFFIAVGFASIEDALRRRSGASNGEESDEETVINVEFEGVAAPISGINDEWASARQNAA